MRFTVRQFFAALGVRAKPRERIIELVSVDQLYDFAKLVEPSVVSVTTNCQPMGMGMHSMAITDQDSHEFVMVHFLDEIGVVNFMLAMLKPVKRGRRKKLLR